MIDVFIVNVVSVLFGYFSDVLVAGGNIVTSVSES